MEFERQAPVSFEALFSSSRSYRSGAFFNGLKSIGDQRVRILCGFQGPVEQPQFTRVVPSHK